MGEVVHVVLLMRCNEISNKGERQSKLFPKFQDFRDLGLMNNEHSQRKHIQFIYMKIELIIIAP